MKIGILIPSTSKGRDWKNIKETYLFKHTLKTFLLTYNNEHNYKFYIGIDRNDRIYDNKEYVDEIQRFMSIMKNTEIEFIYMDDIPKGHLTIMWNKLFQKAYNEKCDYFFQCGDDIEFKTPGWINDCINIQKKFDNFVLTGPIDKNNTRLLTQTFVSRKHMEIFGYYFPPEIINWFCDDWINNIYKTIDRFVPLLNKYLINIGGCPRYNIDNKNYSTRDELNNIINNTRKLCNDMVNRDLKKIFTKKINNQ